jgi:glycosyltransferase involved in cell wall biosynthesis
VKNIHWLSNAPWSPTGYGNQTRLFVDRIKALGYSMTIGAFYGAQGAPLAANGVPVFPASMDAYGNDVLVADAHQVEADVVISLMDVWVLANAVTSQVKWVPWLPVDHDPCPPHVVEALKTAWQPIAFSQFGVKTLRQAGIEPLYVPHGVDTDIFKPAEDRAIARQEMNFAPESFVVGIVAANKGAPSRKAFDQQIRAFAAFQKRHADAVLYLHTDMLGTQGEDIPRIIELSEIPKTAVRTVPAWQYARGFITWEWMARMYTGLDVLLNCTRGEGFGIPIIEAQACGCPVIVTNFSSMPELVYSGWTVGYVDKVFSQNSYQVIPSVLDIEGKLEDAYQRRGDLDFRAQARAGIVVNYDADTVTEQYWKPVLTLLGARLEAETAGHLPAMVPADLAAR